MPLTLFLFKTVMTVKVRLTAPKEGLEGHHEDLISYTGNVESSRGGGGKRQHQIPLTNTELLTGDGGLER